MGGESNKNVNSKFITLEIISLNNWNDFVSNYIGTRIQIHVRLLLDMEEWVYITHLYLMGIYAQSTTWEYQKQLTLNANSTPINREYGSSYIKIVVLEIDRSHTIFANCKKNIVFLFLNWKFISLILNDFENHIYYYHPCMVDVDTIHTCNFGSSNIWTIISIN